MAAHSAPWTQSEKPAQLMFSCYLTVIMSAVGNNIMVNMAHMQPNPITAILQLSYQFVLSTHYIKIYRFKDFVWW